MPHPIGLSFLTVFDVDALEAIRIAAETGYNSVGLRLLPAAEGEGDYPLLADDAMLREARAILADTGVTVADIEIVRLKPETDIAMFEPMLARGAELGASNVLVAGDDPDHSRLTAGFSELCALAAHFDLTCDLEFMPWTGVKTLVAARDIVLAAGAANGGVLIDTLHFDRSKSEVAEIATIPHQHLHYLQLCDGLANYDASDAGLIQVARNARLFPGEGEIDLASILKAVPDSLPLSVEVPKRAATLTVSARDRARQGIDMTRSLLASIGRN
jgi:sugar phosphate isomerase/epimerase